MSAERNLRLVRDDERLARIVWAHLDEPVQGPGLAWVASHGPVEALERLVCGAVGRGSAAATRLAALDLDGALRGARAPRCARLAASGAALLDRRDQVALAHLAGALEAHLGGERLQLGQSEGAQRAAARRDVRGRRGGVGGFGHEVPFPSDGAPPGA